MNKENAEQDADDAGNGDTDGGPQSFGVRLGVVVGWGVAVTEISDSVIFRPGFLDLDFLYE